MSKFLELQPAQPKYKLLEIFDQLDEEDREALQSVLADPKIQATSIARLLTEMGYPISDRAVQRYRKEVI